MPLSRDGCSVNHDLPLLSIVVPVYNEEAVFPFFCRGITDLVDQLENGLAVEIVLVDDGSHDASWSMICDFARGDDRVRAARLAQNVGHQQSLLCGYELAGGDVVVSLDADLQDPPAVILDLLAAWRAGAEIVLAVRDSRAGDAFWKRFSAWAFYRVLDAIGGQARRDCGDFRLLSREALHELLALPRRPLFLRGMVGLLRQEKAEVHYHRAPRRAGVSKYSLGKLIRLALDGFLSARTVHAVVSAKEPADSPPIFCIAEQIGRDRRENIAYFAGRRAG